VRKRPRGSARRLALTIEADGKRIVPGARTDCTGAPPELTAAKVHVPLTEQILETLDRVLAATPVRLKPDHRASQFQQMIARKPKASWRTALVDDQLQNKVIVRLRPAGRCLRYAALLGYGDPV
jgi:hypothetical protein